MTSGAPDSPLRRNLDVIVAAALAAVDPEALARRALLRAPLLGERVEDRSDLAVIAVGKAARGMARGALDALGSRVRDTLIVAPASGESSTEASSDTAGGASPIQVIEGGHPLPHEGSVTGAEAVLGRLRQAGSHDRIVFLLSGGASALLTLPAEGVSLTDLTTTTRLLMEAGADIGELNTVRKHLDRVKGGGLARAAAPTPLWAGILSDVVGDRLDVIGSGPVSPDPTTYGGALDVVRGRISRGVPSTVLRHLQRGARGEIPETPVEGDPCFRRVETTVVGNAETAMEGAAAAARKLGYEVRFGESTVTGEARDVGRSLGKRARRLVEETGGEGAGAVCHLSAGETTVTVTGDGRGGPNQEVALGAALELDAPPTRGVACLDVIVASLGTDGIDGPTDAAGAVADPTTVRRARRMGLSPEAALRNNDSYGFFRGLGDHMVTGPTGTNVMDLHVVLAGSADRSRPPR